MTQDTLTQIPKSPIVGIKIPRELDADIERHLAGTGVTKKQFVADAIRTHLLATGHQGDSPVDLEPVTSTKIGLGNMPVEEKPEVE